MTGALSDRIRATLIDARDRKLLRERDCHEGPQGPVIHVDGRPLQNFTSNDYLGLASHPRVTSRVMDALGKHGFGSGAAALLSGRSSLHAELERRFAACCGFEGALLFSSGFLANTGVLPALMGKTDLCVHDRLNHASLIDGVVASGCAHKRYRHADLQSAAERLAADPGAEARFLVSESVFSMDGDRVSGDALAAVASGNDATLYIDDAHGFGVTGDNGLGVCAELSAVDRSRTLVMITFGKALGAFGAVVLGAGETIDYLVQRARTYIYDTAPPPVAAAAVLEALDLATETPLLRQRLIDNIARFRAGAARAGIDLLPSSTPIQPVVIGEDGPALEVAARARAAGYYVRAVRPPTVPRGTARIRLTISAAHEAATIDGLVGALAEALP